MKPNLLLGLALVLSGNIPVHPWLKFLESFAFENLPR